MTTSDHEHHHEPTDATTDPAEYWEERYSGAEPVWSGRVNTQLADRKSVV